MMPNTVPVRAASKYVDSAAESLVAILLAGGLSTRMGYCKQLHPLCGKPLIQYGIEMLLEAGFAHLVITVNAETQQPIAAIMKKLAQKQPCSTGRCVVVFNPEPERGQGYSSALAVKAARAFRPMGFLFCTADQPFLRVSSIRKLCACFRDTPHYIVSAAFNGTHCSPVIFPAALADELSCLDGNIGGRTIMNAHPELILYSPLYSEMEAFDIDTPEDFKRAEEYLQRLL